MLRVALTGGVGSGKSTAAAIFRELGCFVSQSDEVARAMMQPGEPVYAAIVRHFGPVVIQPDTSLNRAVLAQLAFVEGRAEELNGIVHPAVIAAQAAWMASVAEVHPHAIAMIESALVFETRHGPAAGGEAPWRQRFDCIVLVTAPEPVRVHRYVERYMARRNGSDTQERTVAEADARARMQAQMPEEQKAVLSDVVIENSGSLEDLRARVTVVWQQLQSMAAATNPEKQRDSKKRNATVTHP